MFGSALIHVKQKIRKFVKNWTPGAHELAAGCYCESNSQRLGNSQGSTFTAVLFRSGILRKHIFQDAPRRQG
jgi:hypothetical protein